MNATMKKSNQYRIIHVRLNDLIAKNLMPEKHIFNLLDQTISYNVRDENPIKLTPPAPIVQI